MNLLEVMEEIGAQLGTIAGLRVVIGWPDSITPPTAIVGFPEADFDATYGRGSDRLTVPVWIAVGRIEARSSALTVAPFVDGSGASSVKAVVEAGSYTAFDTVRVSRAEPDMYRTAGADYLAYVFDLDIMGTGA